MFNSFDVQHKQELTFNDFVIGLSTLTRGTIDERLKWIFTLYDVNSDGVVTKDELHKIVSSVHDLMGRFTLNTSSPAAGLPPDPAKVTTQSSGGVESRTALAISRLGQPTNKQQPQTVPAASLNFCEIQTESLFKKFDLNNDGTITLEEFLEVCHKVCKRFGKRWFVDNNTKSATNNQHINSVAKTIRTTTLSTRCQFSTRLYEEEN